MKKFDEWFFPAGETHLPEWMTTKNQRVDGRLTYQYHKYEEAMKWVKERRVAIDIGAHIGLWSFFLARDFDHVAAFEPVPLHQDCWYKNMQDKTNAELFRMALGDSCGHVMLETRPESTGGTQVCTGEVTINKAVATADMWPLDKYNLSEVDFIKIDCEGYELNILNGAVKTLLACKPCVIVEQKGDMAARYGHEKQGAVKFLQGLGAKLRGEISGDFILSW